MQPGRRDLCERHRNGRVRSGHVRPQARGHGLHRGGARMGRGCADLQQLVALPGLGLVVCGSRFVVCGVWCVVCGLWCVVCGLWFVVCGLWFVVCGVWFVGHLRCHLVLEAAYTNWLKSTLIRP